MNVIYQLFIGTFSGTLAPDYAAAYLAGQSFAFELSAALLVLAAIFSLARGKESRTIESTPPIPASMSLTAAGSTENPTTVATGDEIGRDAPNPLERQVEELKRAYAEQMRAYENEVEQLFSRFLTRVTESLNARLLEFEKSLDQAVTRHPMQCTNTEPTNTEGSLSKECRTCGRICLRWANYCDRCGSQL